MYIPWRIWTGLCLLYGSRSLKFVTTTDMAMTYLVGYKVLVIITDLEVQTELPHERPRV